MFNKMDYKIYKLIINKKSMKMILKIIFLTILISISSAYLQYCPPSYFFDVQHCETCLTNCLCSV